MKKGLWEGLGAGCWCEVGCRMLVADTSADPNLGSALSIRLLSTLPARHRMQNTEGEIVLRDLQKPPLFSDEVLCHIW